MVNGGKSWLMAAPPCIMRQRADAGELMHEAVAGNERAILHHRVAAEQRAVGHNHVVADDAIVRDVRVCHEEIVRADDGFRVRLASSGAP